MSDSIKINSIFDYFKVIEQYNLGEYYSRGENKDYKNTKLYSTALRNYDSRWPSFVEKFRFEVAHTINDLQNQYFLGFAQHHKVKTNLLDFSASPLVSLYFASKLEDNLIDDENGFVYFISKSKSMNINFLLKYFDVERPLIEEVYNWNESFISELIHVLRPLFTSHPYDYLNSLFNIYLYILKYFESSNFDLDKVQKLRNKIEIYQEKLKIAIKEDIFGIDSHRIKKPIIEISEDLINIFNDNNGSVVKRFIDKYYSIIHDDSIQAVINREVYIYLICICLSYYIKLFHFSKDYTSDFDFPFYLIYNVPFIDERIKNQNSLFVYQIWNEAGAFQIIKPDFSIEICNKPYIQKQLNDIGINEKFIFCDYDHIGKYYSSVNIKERNSYMLPDEIQN